MNESKPHDQNRRLTQVVRAWFGHGSGKHFPVRAGRFGSGMVRAWFGQPLSGSGREAVRAWFGHGSGRLFSVRAGCGRVRAAQQGPFITVVHCCFSLCGAFFTSNCNVLFRNVAFCLKVDRNLMFYVFLLGSCSNMYYLCFLQFEARKGSNKDPSIPGWKSRIGLRGPGH